MEFTKLNNYVELLDFLIRKECTGTADEFAKKLGVSRRTLQNYLQQLKEIEVPIDYDHYKRTYKYTKKGKLTFGFTSEELNKIKGGQRLNSILNQLK